MTHSLLPSKAASGQITVKEIHQSLNLIGLLDAKQFYLFGNPISKSPSPTMHNTGFKFYSLPYNYTLCESEDINVVAKKIRENNFGGVSAYIYTT